MTHEEWKAEARRRFGDSPDEWRFVCPCCGHVARVRDWREAGADEGAIAFSCVGRWRNAPAREAFGTGPGPCNYAGGGLIRLNPVRVVDEDGREHEVFAFAEGE